MTLFGAVVALAGAALLAGGAVAHWAALAVLGAGMVALDAGSLLWVQRRPAVSLERAVEPARVEKGRPAVVVVHASNRSRRAAPPLDVEQRIGELTLTTRLPRLRAGGVALRTYQLPTDRRGAFEVGPPQVVRADAFGLCRKVQRLGPAQDIVVHPRLIPLRALAIGSSRHLEGPSSDTAPQGSTTFHRLREYVVGDDLRSVHWPSTARLGTLVVRHDVDTAQPYTVVLLDLNPEVYSEETFEEAVDVAASVTVAMSAGKAPVQLRTTAGARLGGPRQRDAAPAVDYLARVAPAGEGSLAAELTVLRRDRGGTALVVVTGRLDAAGVPPIAALSRRFDRVVAVSVVQGTLPAPRHPGVAILAAPTADAVVSAWNVGLGR